MKQILGASATILVLSLAITASAQITRTATFENFTAGQTFPNSFVDPLSGITFEDETVPHISGFIIANDPDIFPVENYLNVGTIAGVAVDFGFMGNLPVPADQVTINVGYDRGSGNISTLLLEGFSGANGNGSIVAQQSPITNSPSPFTLQITSSQYNINSFRVISNPGLGTGYSDISYTILPEPSVTALIFAMGVAGMRRRR